MNYIQLSQISKYYSGHKVLQEIEVNVTSGEFCALLGPNGAGKTTLLNILAGLEFAQCCHGHILGRPYSYDLGELNNQISLVSDKINYNINIPLRSFIEKISHCYEYWDQKLFDNLINQRELPIDQKFSNLAHGQQLQFMLTTALSHHPKILLVDEVISFLDIHARKFFIKQLKTFAKNGGVVILASNIINEIQHYCDKAIILYEGQVLWNHPMEYVAERFIKIRHLENQGIHELFRHPECYWVHMNTDRSQSYMLDRDKIAGLEIPVQLKDRRKINLEELYMYHIEKQLNEKNI